MSTLNLVKSIGETSNETADVNGYKVKVTAAPILEAIFAKHGDIVKNCIFTSLLGLVCGIVQKIQSDTILLDLETIQNEVSDVKAANIDVSWLNQHLLKFQEVSAFHKENITLKSLKENMGLIVKEGSENLRKKGHEWLLAGKRVNEAEKYVDVMKPVSRKIDDSLSASEKEQYFWRRRLGGLLDPDQCFNMHG